MITAERLRGVCSVEGTFALLRDLGYEVSPIDIAAAGWRRAGIDIPWNGELPDSGAITALLRSLTEYNLLGKILTHERIVR